MKKKSTAEISLSFLDAGSSFEEGEGSPPPRRSHRGGVSRRAIV